VRVGCAAAGRCAETGRHGAVARNVGCSADCGCEGHVESRITSHQWAVQHVEGMLIDGHILIGCESAGQPGEDMLARRAHLIGWERMKAGTYARHHMQVGRYWCGSAGAAGRWWLGMQEMQRDCGCEGHLESRITSHQWAVQHVEGMLIDGHILIGCESAGQPGEDMLVRRSHLIGWERGC
jgi:hypothetical protein